MSELLMGCLSVKGREAGRGRAGVKMKTAQALHFAFPVFPFPVGLGITRPGGEPAELKRKGISVCVCFCFVS